MSQQRSATVTALIIAGSDPSDDADIQADMKAINAFGSYTMSVITALTAQSARGAAGMYAVSVEFVRLQTGTLLEDTVPDTTKIGMSATTELVDAVGEYLSGLTHTVLSPVMVATSGDCLLDEQAVGATCRLCAKADPVTPNLYETAVLPGEEPVATLDELCNQVQRLRDLGACRVLVRGGYLSGGAGNAVDVYADADGVGILCSHRVST